MAYDMPLGTVSLNKNEVNAKNVYNSLCRIYFYIIYLGHFMNKKRTGY